MKWYFCFWYFRGIPFLYRCVPSGSTRQCGLYFHIIEGYMFEHEYLLQGECVLCQLLELPCVQRLLHGKFVRPFELLVLYDILRLFLHRHYFCTVNCIPFMFNR